VAENGNIDGVDWLKPSEEQSGLTRYVETIRERAWMVALATLITTGAAIAYVITAQKQYEAEADLLVTPIAADDTTGTTLGLIRESVDPTRDVETAARLSTTTEVAALVQDKLGLADSPKQILSQVTAAPVAQSDIVALTATANSPEEAQELANSYAESVVEFRTDRMHQQIEQILPGVQSSGNKQETARLEQLAAGPDPTLRVETQADLPTTPSKPRPVLSVAGGLIAGLTLGIAAAFASQLLDPRLRREDQLRASYRLPILARIPRDRSRDDRALSPQQISRGTAEAYRTLRGTLTATAGRVHDPRSVLITGSTPSEGKTTTAVNLAASLALAGDHVILIEADLRRPAIGKALGVTPSVGVVDVLLDNVPMEEALTTSAAYGPNLGLLLADYEGEWASELFSRPIARRLLEDARRLADWVVIDSPPLTEVIDALPLAREADDVLIVTRIGRTRLDKLAQLSELLAESEIRPIGFAVVGVPRGGGGSYEYYGGQEPAGEHQARRILGVPTPGSR
jgi:capsular exopolysaccharide synthesis family protein